CDRPLRRPRLDTGVSFNRRLLASFAVPAGHRVPRWPPSRAVDEERRWVSILGAASSRSGPIKFRLVATVTGAARANREAFKSWEWNQPKSRTFIPTNSQGRARAYRGYPITR